MLAALKDARPEYRFYFAGTSEMLGRAEEEPQSEKTNFPPRRSAHGISKVADFDLTRNYREVYGIHAFIVENSSLRSEPSDRPDPRARHAGQCGELRNRA